MRGRRVELELFEGGGFGLLEPGQYGKLPTGVWYFCTPSGHHGNLAKHKVAEHADGTITVAPSILVEAVSRKGKRTELWHGYLERGVWRTV